MTLNRGLPCQRSHPREFAVRPTLAGDICILLETTLPEEIADLKARQAELQSIYGGVPVPLIHLTCQRFSNLDVLVALGCIFCALGLISLAFDRKIPWLD